MRILLTGASSFTGAHFAQALSAAGHQVTCLFRGAEGSYDGVRKARVDALTSAGAAGAVEAVWGVEFGDDAFFAAVAGRSFDLYGHHGAEMADYRSPDFDALYATGKNTRALKRVLATLADGGCRRILYTGSVFEPYEGFGDPQQRAFSPYGLSKHLTFEMLRLACETAGLSLGKFVIPNPFGPQEEFRYTSYLAKTWAAGGAGVCGTPVYVRDNIPVTLLAAAYVAACEAMPEATSHTPGLSRFTPSGYIESQSAFTRRLAREIAARTGWACDVSDAAQTAFPEPLVRVNGALAAQALPQWDEAAFWDALAAYYVETFGG